MRRGCQVSVRRGYRMMVRTVERQSPPAGRAVRGEFTMDYVRLGSSGLQVSRICLGMMSYGDPSSRAWMLGEDAAESLVRQAVEAGVIFFDTADDAVRYLRSTSPRCWRRPERG